MLTWIKNLYKKYIVWKIERNERLASEIILRRWVKLVEDVDMCREQLNQANPDEFSIAHQALYKAELKADAARKKSARLNANTEKLKKLL